MTIDKATLDTLGFIMTVGGIVLSIVALLLSILFYAWADRQAKESDKTLVELRAATDGLGQVVTTLRDESFSLLKSAYTDMGELAKYGVQRDSPVTREVEVQGSQASDDSSPAAIPNKRTKYVISKMSDEQLLDSATVFAPHFIERRGSNYAPALKELFRLIRPIVADLPKDGTMSGEEIAEALASEGYDQDEVLFGLAMMAQVGRLAEVH